MSIPAPHRWTESEHDHLTLEPRPSRTAERAAERTAERTLMTTAPTATRGSTGSRTPSDRRSQPARES